jgi:glucose-6-phosphate isomerase
VLLLALHKRFGNAIFGRVVIVGDAGTPLSEYGEKRGIPRAYIPTPIGGRFSVFTVCGLVPLALLGCDIEAFVGGAQAAIWKGVTAGSDAEASALAILATARDRRIIHVLFAEDVRLHSFALWYEQLLAESLGKRSPDNGATGVLPVPMSPRELHSTAQLYFSGFPGVLTTFMRAEPMPTSYTVSESECGALLPLHGSRAFNRIPAAIMDGVQTAYVTEGMPHAVLDFGELSLHTLGYAMAEKMLEVMYIARVWGINAFDQPHVELYKKATRKLLGDHA